MSHEMDKHEAELYADRQEAMLDAFFEYSPAANGTKAHPEPERTLGAKPAAVAAAVSEKPAMNEPFESRQARRVNGKVRGKRRR
jgi:hypothetical protein